jgi:YD repeat-containing protein
LPTYSIRDGDPHVEVDYDASGRLTTIRCANNTGKTVTVTLTRGDASRTYSQAFGAGTNTLAVPTTVAGRVVVTARDRQRLDGLFGGIMVA